MLFVLPILCAMLLRWVRCPGWPVVGGVVAGLLIGPTILGRVAPNAFEQWFVGGVAERTARDVIVRRHELEGIIARRTGRDEVVLLALQTQHSGERIAAETTLSAARWKAQRPLRSYTTLIIALALLGGGLLRPPRGPTRAGMIGPWSIGVWSAALPGGLVFGGLRLFGDVDPAPAALAAAAVAIGPWMLTPIDRTAADVAEVGGARLVEMSGRVASLVAIAVAASALTSLLGARGLGWCASLLALPIGWMLPRVIDPRLVRTLLDFALVPCLAASVAVHVDINAHFELWMLIVLVALSGDGRWLGAFFGAMVLGGRAGLRTMRLVLGTMACGPTQLAIAAIGAVTWSLPGPVVLGLMLGAVVMEMTVGARRSMARRLIATEAELRE